MNFIKSLQNAVFGPRRVSSIVRDANALVAELRDNARTNHARANRMRAIADGFQTEADRAARIAGRVENLIS